MPHRDNERVQSQCHISDFFGDRQLRVREARPVGTAVTSVGSRWGLSGHVTQENMTDGVSVRLPVPFYIHRPPLQSHNTSFPLQFILDVCTSDCFKETNYKNNNNKLNNKCIMKKIQRFQLKIPKLQAFVKLELHGIVLFL